MIALLLAAFILFLYTPHLLFKFAAATKYDFITRKELPQVEEFFAAGLPSAFLNGLTFIALYGGYLLIGRPPMVLDRAAAALIFQKDPDLSQYLATASLSLLACYLGALAVFSWFAGRFYGDIVARVALAGGPYDYVQRAWHARLPWRKNQEAAAPWRVSFVAWRLVLLAYRRAWGTFYAQYEQPLYPDVLRNSYAFVHTTHGLYHGILFQLTKASDGDLDGIVLVAASKFSRRKEEECLSAGVNPISDLSGPLFIKWSEITDINYPSSAVILEEKRLFYKRKLHEYAARAKRSARYARYRRLHERRKKMSSSSATPPPPPAR